MQEQSARSVPDVRASGGGGVRVRRPSGRKASVAQNALGSAEVKYQWAGDTPYSCERFSMALKKSTSPSGHNQRRHMMESKETLTVRARSPTALPTAINCAIVARPAMSQEREEDASRRSMSHRNHKKARTKYVIAAERW